MVGPPEWITGDLFRAKLEQIINMKHELAVACRQA
jgi:hypothetical protein